MITTTTTTKKSTIQVRVTFDNAGTYRAQLWTLKKGRVENLLGSAEALTFSDAVHTMLLSQPSRVAHQLHEVMGEQLAHKGSYSVGTYKIKLFSR